MINVWIDEKTKQIQTKILGEVLTSTVKPKRKPTFGTPKVLYPTRVKYNSAEFNRIVYVQYYALIGLTPIKIYLK